jgi:hypothetical protein
LPTMWAPMIPPCSASPTILTIPARSLYTVEAPTPPILNLPTSTQSLRALAYRPLKHRWKQGEEGQTAVPDAVDA